MFIAGLAAGCITIDTKLLPILEGNIVDPISRKKNKQTTANLKTRSDWLDKVLTNSNCAVCILSVILMIATVCMVTKLIKQINE